MAQAWKAEAPSTAVDGQEASPAPVGLSRAAAEELANELWVARAAELAAELQDEDEAEAFELDGRRLRVKELRSGSAAFGARSLWISLHGGGRAGKSVNDGQWENQLRLYRPPEGIYVAPRAPTDTWDLWHQSHVDGLLDRLIASYIVRHGVDPDRVYLLGYSAGGDGVYQLGPRMADRFAAAAMMAGHPNDARPDGLRNLPFALFVGAEDKAYGRDDEARTWSKRLAALRAEDSGGYEHLARILPGKGHWMDGEDRAALPWMERFERRAWPKRVVWVQDDVTHGRFYWLAVERGSLGARVTVEVDGQTLRVTEARGVERLRLRLSDALLDLDRPIRAEWAGKTLFEGVCPRSREAVERSLRERADPSTIATAELVLEAPAD
ncbi:MAG: alpha/beta hydrolase [Planctomycetota bacterium]